VPSLFFFEGENFEGLMREFTEADLHEVERRVREAERHVVRQQVVLAKLEMLDDAHEARLARLYLALWEQQLQLARKELRRLQAQRARASFRVVGK
jgi:hypothetical protein